MKKIASILLLIFLSMPILQAYELSENDKKQLNFDINICENIKQTDIPTIFLPGILASWYSEEGYNENKIKRWIPDPITHVYDTLFYTFKSNGYSIKDVFYKDEFNTYIDGNPKQSLYLFGYDWKKDNKVTAKLLSDLILQIRLKYQEENGCDIGTVNIVAHSMGGLVARAMLEDMCVSDEELINFYNRKGFKQGELKNFKTVKCDNFTRITNFITISTPQRGAPSSFPLWTDGNINQTDSLVKSTFLKQQFGISSNEDMYKIIHGYNSKIPNGIVTIGQLLPDVNKSNIFNNELIYINQNNNKLKSENHPINDFLEELNKQDNINKMFSNISGKYTLYYSELTGNNEKNNIIGFNLSDYYRGTDFFTKYKDNSSNYNGLGLYGFYPEKNKIDIYNIDENIRNEDGIGGDGTVPTRNLFLVPNDVDNGKMVINNEFESNKIKCYDDELKLKGYYELKQIENQLTKKVGETPLEMCSHTKMPMLTSIQIFEKISGINIRYDSENKISLIKEQNLLYNYLGYADYKDEKIKTSYRSSIVGKIKIESKYDVGLLNNFNVNNIFEKNFKSLFENKSDINYFIKNKNDEKLDISRKELNFGGDLIDLIRYEVLSPINLIIEDEQGRKIGIDPDTGMIINEIPGAWTSGDTELSNEPEFFIIPKTGTGEVRHKITSYPTGNGEYHIVMNEIKDSSEGEDENANFIIEGFAKQGEIEKYVIGIKGNKSGFIKVDLEKEKLDEKYGEVLKKLIEIIDSKYNDREKQAFKNKLMKIKEFGFGKFKGNERLIYLVEKLIEHLK